MIWCFHCKQTLPDDKFSTFARRKFYAGLIKYSRCIACGKAVRKGALVKVEKKLEHPGLSKKNRAKYQRRAQKLFYVLHVRPRMKSNAHRTKKLQARPPWCKAESFRPIYDECVRKTRETGVQHEVDHIVPLRGKKVSGLDVPWNLQILTKEENRHKHNRFGEVIYEPPWS